MGQKVAIVGSREWTDFKMIRDYVYTLDEDDIVVSGGARGVDQFVEFYARERGMTVLVFRPDWAQHDRQAGLLRNHDIVNECDRLVAFWDGVSTGTQHSIRLAEKAGKPTLVFQPDSTSS